MVYLGQDEVKPEEQHGSIRLTSSKGVQFLQCMPEKEVDTSTPSIKHLDDLVVTAKGPACYFKNLELEFDLFSHAYTDTQSINWDSKAQDCETNPMFQVRVKWDADIESIYSEYDLACSTNVGHFEL